jgi:hypothetical protein
MQGLTTGSLGAISTGLQGVSQVAQGFSGFQAGKYNASVADANARQAQLDGAASVTSLQAKYRSAMGNQIAAAGASGFALGTGSTLDVLNQSRLNETLDALNIRRRADMTTQGYEAQAAMARAGARDKLASGFVGAVGTIASNKIDYANQSKAFGNGGGAYDAAAIRMANNTREAGPFNDPGSIAPTMVPFQGGNI